MKKRVSIIFFLVLCFITSFSFSVFASQLVYAQYHFPDPSLSGNLVIASETLCKVYYILDYTGAIQFGQSSTTSSSSSTYSGSIDESGLVAQLSYDANSNTMTATFTNMYSYSIHMMRVNYNQAGTQSGSVSFSIGPLSTVTQSFAAGSYISGFYSNGFILDSSVLSLPLGNISFSNDIDHTTDYYNITSVLETISSSLSSIYSQDSSCYDMLEQYINDFFYTHNVQDGSIRWTWYRLCNEIDQFSSNMYNFASDFNYWYHNYYIPKTDRTNELLEDILSNLDTTEEYTTSVVQSEAQSQVDIYESQEQNLMDSQGSVLDNANSVLGSWDSGLANSSSAFGFIRWVFSTFIENYLALFLIIPLTFGLIVLVLGRRIQR